MRITVLPSVLLWVLVFSNDAVYFESVTDVVVFCSFKLKVMSNESSSLNVEITTPDTFVNSSSKTLNISLDNPGFITGYFIKSGSSEFICTWGTNSTNLTTITSKDISIVGGFNSEQAFTIGDLLNYNISIENQLISDLTFEYSISLLDSSKNESANINGVLEKSSSSNNITFDELRIIRKGQYYIFTKILIRDSSLNQYELSYTSSSFSITSSIVQVLLECNSQHEQFMNEKCSLIVSGNNNQEYLDGFSANLKLSDNSTLGNWIEKIDVYNSSTQLEFYYTSYGNIELEVTVSSSDDQILTNTTRINVQASNFIIGNLKVKFIQDVTSKTSFDIELTIKSASGSIIDFERLNNPNIDLEIMNNTNEYSGKIFTVNDTKKDKVITFNLNSNPHTIQNLKILSSGSFYFKFSTSSIKIPSNVSNIITVTNSVAKIDFISPSTSNFFDFKITFKLYGDDDLLFIGDSVLLISENSDLGLIGVLKYPTTKTGEITSESLHFLSSGQAGLKFSVGQFSVSRSFTVSQSKIILTIEDPVISK